MVMKRALIITMLLLMIVTSLNAGTLAIYTSTVDLTAPITAKRFALGVNKGSADEFNLMIAPGDMVSYYFAVSNTDSEGRHGEVDMDLQIHANFSQVFDALPGIQISLVQHLNGRSRQLSSCDSEGLLSYNQLGAFSASAASEHLFSLVFSWPDSDEARRTVMTARQSLPLSIYIRGTQHV